MNRPEEIRAILQGPSTWFVVGLRNNPARDAYEIAGLLQAYGKRVIPIHPRAETVHGEKGYATIADAAAAVGPPDVVDVFVRSELAGPIADQAIAAGAGAVWFQFGIIDHDAAQRVTDAGLTMVMDRCPAVEFPRLVEE
jgi:predicted CoA-binding protein